MFNVQGLPKHEISFHTRCLEDVMSFLLYTQTHCGIKDYLICLKSAPYRNTIMLIVKTVRKSVKRGRKA